MTLSAAHVPSVSVEGLASMCDPLITRAGALAAAGWSAQPASGAGISQAACPGADAPRQRELQCVVCFEAPRKRSVVLPCGHVTCDTCWKVDVVAHVSLSRPLKPRRRGTA